MGAQPTVYSVLQLHVVNRNQNVLRRFKIRKQMKKWCKEKRQEPRTFSYGMCFSRVGRSEGRLREPFPVSLDICNPKPSHMSTEVNCTVSFYVVVFR